MLRLALAAVVLALAACGAAPGSASSAPPPASVPDAPTAAPPATDALPAILVFSRTAGYRHASIPDGIAAIREIGTGRWTVDATEDPAAFTADNLRRYRAVVFLSTTGNVLGDGQQAALEGFVRAGGGWAGVHAAADTEYDWPWYGRLAGAWFRGHPKIQPATVRVEDRTHRSTRMLPAEWRRTDEWYSFRIDPRSSVHVLASLDESTYDPEKNPMGDHPIAWCHEFDGGRAWYTALGHTKESYADPLFRAHLREGIAWSAGLPETDAAPPAPGARSAARGAAILADASAAPASPWRLIGAVLPVAFAVATALAGHHGFRAPALAVVFPGLGQVAAGHRRRGFLGMAAVVGMFLTGLLVGGVDSVDSVEDGPWFVAQACNGPAAFVVDAVNQRVIKAGKVGELLPAPPPDGGSAPPMVSTLKGLGPANEFGTLFIALGGLMNLVLIMDAGRREPA